MYDLQVDKNVECLQDLAKKIVKYVETDAEIIYLFWQFIKIDAETSQQCTVKYQTEVTSKNKMGVKVDNMTSILGIVIAMQQDYFNHRLK